MSIPQRQISPLQILIVEDEAIIAEDLRVSLTQLGYQIAGIASSYEEAMELLRSTSPDFIMMDIMLSGRKDGITLAAEVQRSYQIPFLFLTSHSDKGTVERAKAVHPGAYLLKPFEKEDIFASIEVAISNYNSRFFGQNNSPSAATTEETESFYIKSKHVYVKVLARNIHYLKSDGNYLHIYGTNFHHILRATQKGIIDILPKDQFIRTHRSYVVNISSIMAIYPDTLDVPHATIPLQKGFREALLSRLNTL